MNTEKVCPVVPRKYRALNKVYVVLRERDDSVYADGVFAHKRDAIQFITENRCPPENGYSRYYLTIEECDFFIPFDTEA